jgi:GAF domain-containing protein
LNDYAVPFISEKISTLVQKVSTVKSLISFPIVYENKALGMIAFGKNYIDDFETEFKVLQAFSEHIATAIVNAEKYGKLERELEELKQKS